MFLADLQPYGLTEAFPLDPLPRSAENELERGHSVPAVLMLLALDPPKEYALAAYREEVHGLVRRAIREVGVPPMTVEDAWWHVIREEAERGLHGTDIQRTEAADTLSSMYDDTHFEALREFRRLDREREDYWDSDSDGPIEEARLEAAQRLLSHLQTTRERSGQ